MEYNVRHKDKPLSPRNRAKHTMRNPPRSCYRMDDRREWTWHAPGGRKKSHRTHRPLRGNYLRREEAPAWRRQIKHIACSQDLSHGDWLLAMEQEEAEEAYDIACKECNTDRIDIVSVDYNPETGIINARWII